MIDNNDRLVIRQIAKDVLDDDKSENQFGVSLIPAHTHNGTDSLQVSYASLANKQTVYSFTLIGSLAGTATNYSVFFLAPIAMSVLGINEVHTVKGTDGSAVTLNIEKLTGTTVPGSGTNLLSTAFNLKGNINTVQAGSLVQSIASTNLANGDRLALVLAGTPTSVANVTVSIVLGS